MTETAEVPGVTFYAPGDVLPDGRILIRGSDDSTSLLAFGIACVTIEQARAALAHGWKQVDNYDNGLVLIEKKGPPNGRVSQ